jgi:hypothetical protein
MRSLGLAAPAPVIAELRAFSEARKLGRPDLGRRVDADEPGAA